MIPGAAKGTIGPVLISFCGELLHASASENIG